VNDEQLVTDAGVVRSVLARAHEGLVDRELLVEAIALCAVAGEHLLVVGPPGTAKSQAVRSVAQLLGGRYFEYLLGRFSEPSEIFGPVDLRRLREGVVEVSTDGMLPEADIAFLDEVFLGSTAILNTLLGLLNERVYRRGSTARRVPLRVCVGATNRHWRPSPTGFWLGCSSNRSPTRCWKTCCAPVSAPQLSTSTPSQAGSPQPTPPPTGRPAAKAWPHSIGWPAPPARSTSSGCASRWPPRSAGCGRQAW
jgi:MoxR-like ATPase